ncbi:YgaP family membrane protein [Neotabrizicola sp. VNH66]|uniref:YgaP family membrane protein n=1 Tax=Neotabrizicola sp. VNH66 TaxID=3400918 RepID=UPI003C0EECB9
MFTTNVGGIDRILRIVIGAALIVWFFVDQGTTGFWHWAKLIGIVPLLTGLFSTCPLYSVLGLNTCPVRR